MSEITLVEMHTSLGLAKHAPQGGRFYKIRRLHVNTRKYTGINNCKHDLQFSIFSFAALARPTQTMRAGSSVCFLPPRLGPARHFTEQHNNTLHRGAYNLPLLYSGGGWVSKHFSTRVTFYTFSQLEKKQLYK